MGKIGEFHCKILSFVLMLTTVTVAKHLRQQSAVFFKSPIRSRKFYIEQDKDNLKRNHALANMPKYDDPFGSFSWFGEPPGEDQESLEASENHVTSEEPLGTAESRRFPAGEAPLPGASAGGGGGGGGGTSRGGPRGGADPDDAYLGRVSYNFQRPYNVYEDDYVHNVYWPNHKYRPETLTSLTTMMTTTTRPPPPPPPPPAPSRRPGAKRPLHRPGGGGAGGSTRRVPPNRARPPPGWELVSFQVADGNRTIHVRRFVRRPMGGAGAERPLAPFFLLPPHNASLAVGPSHDVEQEDEGDDDGDLQAQGALALPAWVRPGVSSADGDLSHSAKSKLAKFLSLFTVIRFANTPCPSQAGVPGTCFHRLECASMGGAASGSCARGFGVCCLFQLSCGARTVQNCSYFVSPGWPGPAAAMACVLAVEKLPGVTQLRLDLLTFEMARPMDGMCIDQQFVVSGQNINGVVPVLCGENSGQHVYVDVDVVRGPLRLAALGGGRFRVKVTQLHNGDARAAPRNCLQYLQGTSGTLRSFNFQGGSYTNNLNYAICIRKEPGYCSITYSVRGANMSGSAFQMVNVDQDGEPLVPAGQAGAEAFNCPDDYIVIGGLRLCGDRLNDASQQVDFTQNAPVTDSTSGPFVVQVRTNGNTVGQGFELDYKQNLCRS